MFWFSYLFSCVGILIASCNRGHIQWQQVFKQFHFTLADITGKYKVLVIDTLPAGCLYL